jgi:hypothetical protein
MAGERMTCMIAEAGQSVIKQVTDAMEDEMASVKHKVNNLDDRVRGREGGRSPGTFKSLNGCIVGDRLVFFINSRIHSCGMASVEGKVNNLDDRVRALTMHI